MGELRERYFISGEINSEVDDQEGKMQELAERYSDGEISWLDGVSVDYPDWHFNVRPSNTEPLLRLNLESLVSREDMEAKSGRSPGRRSARDVPEEALEEAREAGIHRLQIPTPFAVGRVNCYLIEDEPLTLVDTGPNSGKSLDELEHQLSDLGHSIADIELVVLTHQHIDHLGLVEIIADRSGADVAAIDVVVPFVENFGDDIEARRQVRRLADAPPRDPRGRGGCAALGLPELPRLGREGEGHAAPPRRRAPEASGTARSRCSTARGTAPRTRCSGTRIERS